MFTLSESLIIEQAKSILATKLITTPSCTSPEVVKDYCQLRLAHLEHEVFAVMFLNQKHQIISFDEMFTGTIDGASVYPREVAKAALKHNAAAVIFAHNHPSGISTPTNADERITGRLVSALNLFEIRVLDHIVVGNGDTHSFSDLGLL